MKNPKPTKPHNPLKHWPKPQQWPEAKTTKVHVWVEEKPRKEAKQQYVCVIEKKPQKTVKSFVYVEDEPEKPKQATDLAPKPKLVAILVARLLVDHESLRRRVETLEKRIIQGK
jgi:hypothetical protein